MPVIAKPRPDPVLATRDRPTNPRAIATVAQMSPATTTNGSHPIPIETMPSTMAAIAAPLRRPSPGAAGPGGEGAVPAGSTKRSPFVATSAVHTPPLW